ncbi:hypothetical protein MBM_07776 [Drepanopeziza brunnea f. sp. 'multigermtubi' MB_m1]|uniref:Uncharacterized protein n=1 Tax=Marssonina brunnea f. sp. multigermtubi (strain MB_m1) TaxID=1072389 RepID=K1XNN8_MARBU|nr:uncharacterized protein MBM_07776 [Drepanopeziza brunnea f. sp. 'multigermtubi' MB_m1]EKD14099.1 hypothetical protein MBM_07776 [Drepanopeziza brunnea f. sp. 'multigermtubi' MB_m1]
MFRIAQRILAHLNERRRLHSEKVAPSRLNKQPVPPRLRTLRQRKGSSAAPGNLKLLMLSRQSSYVHARSLFSAIYQRNPRLVVNDDMVLAPGFQLALKAMSSALLYCSSALLASCQSTFADRDYPATLELVDEPVMDNNESAKE